MLLRLYGEKGNQYSLLDTNATIGNLCPLARTNTYATTLLEWLGTHFYLLRDVWRDDRRDDDNATLKWTRSDVRDQDLAPHSLILA